MKYEAEREDLQTTVRELTVKADSASGELETLRVEHKDISDSLVIYQEIKVLNNRIIRQQKKEMRL